MKQNMKAIYKIWLAAAAALLLNPSVFAQDVPYYINEDNGIAYNKYLRAETPTDGQFTIRLETFATGGGERRAIPSDIVLVLDNSGSMLLDYNIPGVTYSNTMSAEAGDTLFRRDDNPEMKLYYSYSYVDYSKKTNGIGTSTPPRTNGSWAPSFSSLKRYLKHTDGKYYRILRGGDATNGYYLYANTPDGMKYPVGTSIVDTRPTTFKDQRSVIYEGTDLYRPETRREKLLDGVQDFIRQIAANNDGLELDAGQVGNQVAIVAFGYPTKSASNAAYTFVVKDFTPVSLEDGSANTVIQSLSGMNFWGDTAIGFGLELAYGRLNNQMSNPAMDPFVKEDGVYVRDGAGNLIVNRSKTVVVFTDGDPTSEGAHDGFPANANGTKGNAIKWSNRIKATGAGAINGRIFSIGLSASADNQNFLEHVSSDYAQPTYDPSTNTYTGTKTSDLYFMDAGRSDLKTVFQIIASIAGGSSTVSSTSLVNVDIVSKSFSLPPNADASKIKIYTAQCLGQTDQTYVDKKGRTHHYLAFADPIPAGEREPVGTLWMSKTVNDELVWESKHNVIVDTVRCTVDPVRNSVSVTGFNYADYWCGLDPDTTHDNTEQYNSASYEHYLPGYRGFKIIIDIPIVVKDGALGGPSVKTNEEGSGLKDPLTDKLLIEYPRPSLPVPVNMWIQKKGLKKGESARLTIQRKPAAESDDAYVYFTSVLLTGKPDGETVMVKLLNLDPAYHYRVLEADWSWTYSNDESGGVLLTEDGKVASTEFNTQNPIVIVNTPESTAVKHAESKVTNVMSKVVTESSATVSSKDHTTRTTP